MISAASRSLQYSAFYALHSAKRLHKGSNNEQRSSEGLYGWFRNNILSMFVPVAYAKDADIQDTLTRYPHLTWIDDLQRNPALVPKNRVPPQQRSQLGYKGNGYLADDDRVATKYFYDTENKSITGYCEFGWEVEGPPGCVHGGCISAVVDELFGRTVAGYVNGTGRAVTANLDVNYRKFVPLNSLWKLQASIEKQEGRKIYVVGRVVDPQNGTVHVEATAIFVLVSNIKL